MYSFAIDAHKLTLITRENIITIETDSRSPGRKWCWMNAWDTQQFGYISTMNGNVPVKRN